MADAVSSVMLHPTVAVFATTSGHRKPPQDLLHLSDTDSDSDSDAESEDSRSSQSDQDQREDDTDEAEGAATRSRSVLSESAAPKTRGFDNTLKVWSMATPHSSHPSSQS